MTRERQSREKTYKAQLQDLGIYDPAFDPEIKTLSELERRRTRAKKEWSDTAEPGGKPSFEHPLYSVIVQLEKDILTHREALGLTPKAMRRIRGPYYETVRGAALPDDPPPAPANVTVLDLVREKYAL